MRKKVVIILLSLSSPLISQVTEKLSTSYTLEIEPNDWPDELGYYKGGSVAESLLVSPRALQRIDSNTTISGTLAYSLLPDRDYFWYSMSTDGPLVIDFSSESRDLSAVDITLFSFSQGSLIDSGGFFGPGYFPTNFWFTNKSYSVELRVPKDTYLIGLGPAAWDPNNTVDYLLNIREGKALQSSKNPSFVDSTVAVSIIPTYPATSDEIFVRLVGEFPYANAVISKIDTAIEGKKYGHRDFYYDVIDVDIKTALLEEVGATAVVSVDTIFSLGLLKSGLKDVRLKVNSEFVDEYYFEVLSDSSQKEDLNGSFRLNMDDIYKREKEPNNQSGVPNKIVPNSVTLGSISDFFDVDIFQLDIPMSHGMRRVDSKSHQLRFEMDTFGFSDDSNKWEPELLEYYSVSIDDFDVYPGASVLPNDVPPTIIVLDDSGNILGHTPSIQANDIVAIDLKLDPGTYYVLLHFSQWVESLGFGQVGSYYPRYLPAPFKTDFNYALSIIEKSATDVFEIEPNNSISEVQHYEPGMTMSGFLFGGDIDYYSYEKNTDGPMKIEFRSENLNTESVRIELLNQHGGHIPAGTLDLETNNSYNSELPTSEGLLARGRYLIGLSLKRDSGQTVRYSLKVTDNWEKRLHVLAQVGRRKSTSPLRTRVDRSVDFTVHSFIRADSSNMEIVEDFQWTVPSNLIGKIESVGSLDLTTVAKVDEEIIFRVGDVESKFRIITTPSKAVKVVIDPPILKIEPGETQRFIAKAQDKFGNSVVRNFGWHVVGDIGTIDGRRGDFKAGNKPGEGWIIAVANNQLIFSDVEANAEGAGKVVVGGGTPQLYSLEQNTPNPFNPSTQISFQLPTNSHVQLTVFNALGQSVEQLIDAPMSSGSHQVEWRSRDHRSGVYFYELRTEPAGETNFFNLKVEPFVARKKMLLVR